MEAEKAPEAPPAAPAKGRGMWIGVVVVAIVIVILLAAVFGGLLSGPPDNRTPEAVYHVGYPGDAGKYLPSLWSNRAQWTAKWFFSEGLKDQTFIDQLKTQGINVTQIVGTAPTTSDDPTILQSATAFNENYSARFGGGVPGLFAPHGYDGLFLIALAMAQSNTTDVTNASFRQAMRDVSSPPGTAIRPGEWGKALGEFGAGRDIDYIGASGANNFDQYGEVGSDYEVWGVNSTGQIIRKQFIPEGSWSPAPPAPAPQIGTRSDDHPKLLLSDINIGVIVSLTGSLAVFGPDISNATTMAMEQINGNGGLWGGSITLVVQDDATTPATGAQAATNMIANNNVKAIIGSLASSVSQAVYDVAKPANVLVMSPASTSPLFTNYDTVDLFWRTAPSDALQGRAAALYAYRDAGWRTVSIFHINNAYGTGLGDVFAQAFTDRGGVILRNVGYEANLASYDSELNSVFTPGAQRAPPAPVSRRPEDR